MEDKENVDSSLCLSPVEPPLGQGGSRQQFEQWSQQSEPSEKVQEYVLEAQHRASHQATLDCISGHGSKPQKVSRHHLGFVGERMLHDWYQPEQNTVWAEYKVFAKLINLKLAPEQQSSVDSGICIDQWALGKSQSQQPFNDWQRILIYSLNASH